MNKPIEEMKMWLAVRRDIEIPAGKLAVQSGHAFAGLAVGVVREDFEFYQRYFNRGGMPKIVTQVRSLEELLRVKEEAIAAGIRHNIVRDAGRTVFSEPTYTVCAFGPTYRSALPPFLKRLRLYQE